MAKHKVQPRTIGLSLHGQKIRLIVDNVLVFRFLRSLHGRFWGIAGISFMVMGFTICFIIRPDLLTISTAFSDFGTDVRTSPYFAASVFVAAYGMWRWRNYLARTWKRTVPVTGLLSVTILGFYVVALVPLSWNNKVHMAGMIVAGISMVLTVLIDGILSKPARKGTRIQWRSVRAVSLLLILSGGWLTFGSSELVGWYSVSLLGETCMLLGYLLWVSVKTYHGEGNRTQLSKVMHKFIQIG